jgi:hydroxypyruvate isomerase
MLFRHLPLPQAIAAARAAGFDAVEMHFPYDHPPEALRAALQGMPLISLNTPPGDLAAGEFGLGAIAGRGAEGMRQAIDWARAAGAGAVHVMAGRAGSEVTVFEQTLTLACDLAPDLTVLIEPLNPFDVPGYHLADLESAARIIGRLSRPNLKLLFDCYHVARIHGDVGACFARYRGIVGHVQFAAVPDRGEPDRGEVDYARLLPGLGWDGWFGAEYRPRGLTSEGLGWLPRLRAAFA